MFIRIAAHEQLSDDGRQVLRIMVDERTKKMWSIMEEFSKAALTVYPKQHGHRVAADPFYSFILGRLDGPAAV